MFALPTSVHTFASVHVREELIVNPRYCPMDVLRYTGCSVGRAAAFHNAIVDLFDGSTGVVELVYGVGNTSIVNGGMGYVDMV